MSSQADPPLLTLLSRATEQERRALLVTLAQQGFDDATLPGARILVVLAEGPRAVQAVAQATQTTKQFAGREVQKLLEADYVHLEQSTHDRRAWQVSIAPRGRALLDASKLAKRGLDQAVAKRLGRRDTDELRRLLLRLLEV